MEQRTKIGMVFVTMAAVVLATFWVAYLAGKKSLALTRHVGHERLVVAHLEEFLSTVKDAETGQRGYLLTGDDNYLGPYRSAAGKMRGELAALDELAAAGDLNPATQQKLVELANGKMAELDKSIEQRRQEGFDAAVKTVKTGVGRQLMDSIRAEAGQAIAIQRDDVAKALVAEDRATMIRTLAFAAGVLINLAFLLWAYRTIAWEIRGRTAAMVEATRQKDLLGVTLASIGDAVIVTDNAGRITFMNSVAESMTGRNQADAMGRPCATVFNIINETSRQLVESPVEKVLRLGTVVGLANHTLLIRKDGSEVPIDDSGAPVRERSGTVRGVVLVFRDFSEHKANERRLIEARNELEAANQAKDRFLATLSHELRTPLTPVLATLAYWEDSGELPSALQTDVQMLRRNVELEARLIDDLLDLTRIVKGKLRLAPEVADVHELLRNVTRMYDSELNVKQLKVTMSLDAERHHVLADPGRLQQVFLNILKNAAKFTPEGGAIDISTGVNPTGDVVMTFTDTGIGLNEETLQRLFRPFEQGAEETVRRYGGLGLGMAISKALMDAQGGTIAAASAGPGQGASFTVALPAAEEPAPRTASSAGEPPESKSLESRRLKILLVEDHADTAGVMSRLLRRAGHTVEVATSVDKATSLATGEPFDLLLSDIGLPDGTGLDLLRDLRARGHDVPAVALTGFGMEEDIAKCRDAGFTAHLTKPVSIEKLQALIQEMAR